MAANERVLVHCVAGVSRSTTMLIAWMMHSLQMQLHAAMEYVRRRRPIVMPNASFLIQLALFEIEIFECCSVYMRPASMWNFPQLRDAVRAREPVNVPSMLPTPTLCCCFP